MKAIVSITWGIVAALSAANSRAAEGTVGNGGNATVCYTDASRQTIVSVEMFDYWEMSRAYAGRHRLRLAGTQATVEENIRFALARIDRFDSVRAEQYRKAAEMILGGIDGSLFDQELPTIDDDHPQAIPSAPCYKEQFAIQLRYPDPGQNRFLISRRLWTNPLVSNETKAGLILHEVIYREFIENGARNSDQARDFNFLVSSDALDAADLAAYRAFLGRYGRKPLLIVPVEAWFGNQKHTFQFHPRFYHPQSDGSISGRIYNEPHLVSANIEGTVFRPFDRNKFVPIVLRKSGRSYFLANVQNDFNNHARNTFRFAQPGSDAVIEEYQFSWLIEFYPDGKLKLGKIREGKIPLNEAGAAIECGPGIIEFWPSGRVRYCTLKSPTEVMIAGAVSEVSWIYFNEAGWIEGAVVTDYLLRGVSGCASATELKGLVYFDANGKVDLLKTDFTFGMNTAFVFLNLDYDTTFREPLVVETARFRKEFTRMWRMNVAACSVSVTAEEEISKLDEHFLSVSKKLGSATLQRAASQFCGSLGFDANARKVASRRITMTELFGKVYDLDRLATREVPLGSAIDAYSVTCSKSAVRRF